MTQSELFYDDIHGALRVAVELLGGAKRIGKDIWPALSVMVAPLLVVVTMGLFLTL